MEFFLPLIPQKKTEVNKTKSKMNLFSGKELALRIYGVNRNGKSDPAILEGFSLKVAELQIGKI